MSDGVWIALIGMVQVVILAWIAMKQTQAATKVAVVATTLETNTAIVDTKLNTLADRVEVIHKATNGMKEELVKEVRDASFAKGVKSETDKR